MSSCNLFAQDTDAFLTKPDSLLTFSDSLSIFQLIDSLLTLDELNDYSQLAFRIGYNSNVLWAGRTLGIDQFGLAPGISYYHKSGLFADASFFWSKDFEPNYYLTILSAGYMHTFSRHFSAMASYDRYFYNLEDEYIPYSNAVTLSPFLEFHPVNFRVDYTYYFGERSVHRVMPSVGVTLEKSNLFKIDKVSFMPSVFMLMGNETFSEIIFPTTRAEWIAAYIRVRQGLPWYRIETRNVFGVMNYAIMLPLNVRHKQMNFSFSYTYNIPKALPGETLTLAESSFLSASLSWFINLNTKKSPL
ncbi:MAG: hypothetical protein QY309_09845 [Cyclobacteriaceae bacterium]|nr:MAG: hypothetical protein QY309_09845 [Cyclobacteriaceae bacterium]